MDGSKMAIKKLERGRWILKPKRAQPNQKK